MKLEGGRKGGGLSSAPYSAVAPLLTRQIKESHNRQSKWTVAWLHVIVITPWPVAWPMSRRRAWMSVRNHTWLTTGVTLPTNLCIFHCWGKPVKPLWKWNYLCRREKKKRLSRLLSDFSFCKRCWLFSLFLKNCHSDKRWIHEMTSGQICMCFIPIKLP